MTVQTRIGHQKMRKVIWRTIYLYVNFKNLKQH